MFQQRANSAPALPRVEAEAVFLRHGVALSALADEGRLRAAWLELGRKYHPDFGGDGRVMGEINAAYDVLRSDMPRSGSPFAAAGRAHGFAGEQQAEYTVWGFDGRALTRGPTVSCGPEEFPGLAEFALRTMRRGFRYQKAILVQRSGERWTVSLIHSAGRHHVPPVRIDIADDPPRDALLLSRLAEFTRCAAA